MESGAYAPPGGVYAVTVIPYSKISAINFFSLVPKGLSLCLFPRCYYRGKTKSVTIYVLLPP